MSKKVFEVTCFCCLKMCSWEPFMNNWIQNMPSKKMIKRSHHYLSYDFRAIQITTTGTHRELSGLNDVTLTAGPIESYIQAHYTTVYGNASSPWLSYTIRSRKHVEKLKCMKVERQNLHITMGIQFLLLKKYTKSLFMGNKQNSCSKNYSKSMHSFKNHYY